MSARGRTAPGVGGSSLHRAALARGLGYLLLWTILVRSTAPVDLAVGALAAAAAAWASLRLLPTSDGGVRLLQLLRMLPRFVRQSTLAGVDVARRAFDPRLPLSPGLVRYPVRLPPGFARHTFATITSLLPASIAAGERPDALVYHCLDDTGPVLAELAAEERRLAPALAPGRADV